MEMLLNAKKFRWRESRLCLCGFYIYMHICICTYLCVYMWLAAYTHIHCTCVYADEIYVLVSSVK